MHTSVYSARLLLRHANARPCGGLGKCRSCLAAKKYWRRKMARYYLTARLSVAEWNLVDEHNRSHAMSMSDAIRRAAELGSGRTNATVVANSYARICEALDDVGRELNAAARHANRMARSYSLAKSLNPEEVNMLLAEGKVLRDLEGGVRMRVSEVESAVSEATECRIVAVRPDSAASAYRRAIASVSKDERDAFQGAATAIKMSASAFLRVLLVLSSSGDMEPLIKDGGKVLVVSPFDRVRLRTAVQRWQTNREQTLASIESVAMRYEASASLDAKQATLLQRDLRDAKNDVTWSTVHVSTITAPLLGVGR